MLELDTPRLLLRQWRPEDRAPFAALNADPDVMRYFPSTLDAKASDAFADHCESRLAERGWGLWAVALKRSTEFVGFVGLEVPNYDLPFNPCTEIGWRLARAHWGRGYATEAARAALGAGFEQLGLEEIVSFTSVINLASRRVMEKTGMIDSGENFLHPAVGRDSRLCEHCLYRLPRTVWLAGQNTAKNT